VCAGEPVTPTGFFARPNAQFSELRDVIVKIRSLL
jgi:hypothetical protein